MMKSGLLIAIYTLLIVVMTSCGGVKRSSAETGQQLITEAQWLSIVRSDSGYTVVEVLNPWQEGVTLQRYILVNRDSVLDAPLPEGVVVRTPLRSVLAYSSVFTNVIGEVDGLASIKGVCDALYFKDKGVQQGLADGSIIDAGSSTAPNMERIIELNPEAIIVSPFQNAGYGVIGSLGVPIIECADYMEQSPLGRAEWIKLFGVLYEDYDRSDSIYTATVEGYNGLKALVDTVGFKPMVLVERQFSGVWNVPSGDSYQTRMLLDAGAEYPWSDVQGVGSLSLDFTQVYDKAENADIWLVRSFDGDMTYEALEGIYALNKNFKAFKERRVYGCNTSVSNLYEEFPFHPELLLRDYITIMHPEVLNNVGELRYFAPLEDR